MNDFVNFRPESVKLPGYVRFSVSKTFMQVAQQNNVDPENVLRELSTSRVLLIAHKPEFKKNKKDPVDRYDVFTSVGTFRFRETEDRKSLFLVNFLLNDLSIQNNAMRNGVCFSVSQGVIVQIRLGTPYDLYYDIVNGKRFGDHATDSVDTNPAYEAVMRSVQKNKADNSIEEDVEEEYQPKRRLANLLDVAEKYAILDSQREENNAIKLGNIPYYSISPVAFERLDRVCYEFSVKNLDETAFKQGTRVEVKDVHEKPHTAEITKLIKQDEDSPATAIRLLFSDHVDIDDLPEVGTFSLTFNTVNKDVQLAAIEKIRTGTAAAQYMDTVFGDNSSQGFDNKNLAQVDRELQAQKYPPNRSQMDAIHRGINAKDVFLVMGPPGTGKTTVILEWVKYFVHKEHKRVLVSSQNNKAVDNVLERLAEEKDINTIRIGSESKLQANVLPYLFENKVKDLREHIADNTDTRRQDLERIISRWTDFENWVHEVQPKIVQLQKTENTFKASLQDLGQSYKKLQNLLGQYQQLEQTRNVKFRSIRILASQITQEEHVSGPMKLFVSFALKRNHKAIESEVEAFREATHAERKLVMQYNKMRAAYQEQYEIARDVDYFTYLDQVAEISGSNIANFGPPARDPGNIWHFFDTARELWNGLYTDFAALESEINRGKQQADRLLSALKDWHTQMVEHQNYALNEIILETVDLVGATCIGINSQKRFQNLHFDITIIDESGQIQVHNALVPMSVSNKVIMLGDHRQIPPTADPDLVLLCEQNNVKTDLLKKSLFEKMYFDLPEENKIMLDTQYRMPAEIADTISEWFYEGRYYSPDFKRGLKGLIPALSSRPYVIVDTSKVRIRHEHDITGQGCDNALEADIIATIVKKISEDPDSDLGQIGVISAYKAQIRLIKRKLSEFLAADQVNEMAATLDSFQGQERDIILYSFTKSSGIPTNKRRIGFLNELRRLNVAMSRCKKTLVMIGDMNFLGGCSHQDIDEETGEPIYEQSEKQFGDFIQKMVSDVKGGRGEMISYNEFCRRMGVKS